MLKKAIASKAYRKFVQKNKIYLSDWDLATLIYNNSELCYEDRMKALLELKNKTSDEKLAIQINERLVRDEKYFDEFCIKTDNAYYVLKTWNENDYEFDGIYLTYQSAFVEGINIDEKFCISRNCYECQEQCGNRNGVFGTIEFNPDGTIGNYFGLYGVGRDDDVCKWDEDRFEGRSLNLPLFFRTGDIVRIIGTNIYGIVDAPDNDEEAVRMQKFAEIGDYSDFQVPVNTVFDGDNYLTIFAHEHVAPSMLEYATFEEGDTRKDFLVYLVKKIYQSPWFGGTGRDKARIPEVLSRVETIWKQYPDLRLGQLLLNVCGPKELFSIEDEELAECFDNNKWGR